MSNELDQPEITSGSMRVIHLFSAHEVRSARMIKGEENCDYVARCAELLAKHGFLDPVMFPVKYKRDRRYISRQLDLLEDVA